jgi:hypothetical protein
MDGMTVRDVAECTVPVSMGVVCLSFLAIIPAIMFGASDVVGFGLITVFFGSIGSACLGMVLAP